MQSSLAWANVVDVGNPDAKMLVPHTPAAFEALLEKCVFTNGADRGVVAGLYRQTIEQALSQTRELRFVKQGWTDKDIEELVKVLPLCTELRRLALDDNEQLTGKGAKLLAAALTHGAAPKLTHLGHEAASSRGVPTSFARSEALRAACAARGIVLASFIKHTDAQESAAGTGAASPRVFRLLTRRGAAASGPAGAPAPSRRALSRPSNTGLVEVV